MVNPIEPFGAISPFFQNFEISQGQCILDKELNQNLKLSRYMSFSSFLSLLNGEFYISKKEMFRDKMEFDVNKIRFCYDEIGSGSKERIQRNLELIRQAKSISQNLLASCWTMKKDEDYLMWVSYTERSNGVMITAQLNNILSSFIKLPPCKVAKIYYQSKPCLNTLDGILFYKSNHYRNEKEVRFYFYEEENDTIEENDTKRGRIYKIEPNIMIDKVLLSPFMTKKEEEYYISTLSKKFPFIKGKIRPSLIKLK